MSNGETAAYIKGLMEGLQLDPEAKETRVLKEIVDLLDELSVSVDELEDAVCDVEQQLDEVDEDLGSLEVDFYGKGEGCGHHCSCHDEEFKAAVVCPNCGELIEFDLEDDEDDDDEELTLGEFQEENEDDSAEEPEDGE